MPASGFNLQLGTVGEWFAGVGGFLAVLVAFYVGRLERDRGKREGLRLEADERQRRQAASLIWVYRDELLYPTVESKSSLPFRDVYIIGTHKGPPLDLEVEGIGTLPPGQSRRSGSPMAQLLQAELDLGVKPGLAALSVHYTDVEGRRWTQDEAGRIRDIP